MIKTNLHTHTNFSDGHNSPEEMVKAAISLGFESIGFSVHSPLTFENDWSCQPENFEKYFQTIIDLKEKYSSEIIVYNGVELDVDHSDIDLSRFDYVIGAVHQLKINGEICDIDLSKDALESYVKKYFNNDYLALSKEYYSLLTKYITDLKPDIVGHFDLVEKYNDDNSLFDSDSPAYKLMVKLFLEKICYECPDVIFEVNTGAMFRIGNKTPYPSRFIMKYLKSHNMRITVSSDSHSIDSLNYNFDEAEEYCRSFGFKEIWIMKNGKFEPIKI